MSGGELDYFYYKLEKHIGDFNDKELDELVKDLAQLFHDREWYLSDDYGEEKWNEARDNFKKKWFGEGARQELPTNVRKLELITKCGTCKHYDREHKHCHHPCFETDDPYTWMVLEMTPDDFCSKYEEGKYEE